MNVKIPKLGKQKTGTPALGIVVIVRTMNIKWQETILNRTLIALVIMVIVVVGNVDFSTTMRTPASTNLNSNADHVITWVTKKNIAKNGEVTATLIVPV